MQTKHVYHDHIYLLITIILIFVELKNNINELQIVSSV